MPERMVSLCKLFKSGNEDVALKEQLELLPIMDAMFTDTNPVPIKYAMSLVGLCSEEVRLPLAPLEYKKRVSIENIVKKYFE